jgi:hypothetical protein
MPLPDKDHRRLVALAAVVLHHDELGRLLAAARHREVAAHAELLAILLVEDVDLHAVALAQVDGLLGEVGRRAVVARQVAQVLRERDALGDRHAAVERGLAGVDLGAAATCRVTLRSVRLGFRRLALQSVEADSRLP